MSVITIFDTGIRQDARGRFCLNDLHRAAGGQSKDRPSKWLDSENIQELIHELDAEKPASDKNQSLSVVKGGNGPQGTYACRELVYAYAMWISAKFHLAVIRAFDAMQLQRIKQAVLTCPQPAYMAEAWFAILRHQASCMVHRALARALQIHESTLCQVLNGSGYYGDGRCGTDRIAHRVLRVFCPHQRVHARQLSLV
ncbi:MAG: KilA-N domain-containing protein [Comamonas sp.]|nr:KilA-N domain-containing protein [Comamonas sp.]